ncbi:pentatricopeptide repeat-containing protein At3g58590 [Arachis stenosperma]|uniref:pentatricopeptide repeat-containing protein At3g58590 n=1 Tax=Arachis stenosperma TaxID=217475 RepID=UPI0025AD5835|nr:pentatricopeptide repeat-containing protein At3g58590 [Arachis stenosperma]
METTNTIFRNDFAISEAQPHTPFSLILTNGWVLTPRHHQRSPQRLSPPPFTATARSPPSRRLSPDPPSALVSLLSSVCARLPASRRASAGECSRPQAVFPSSCSVSSSSAITAPNPTPRLLASPLSSISARFSPRLPPPVSARAVRGCCFSSSVGVAACTALLVCLHCSMLPLQQQSTGNNQIKYTISGAGVVSCMSCHGHIVRHGQHLLKLVELCSITCTLDATKCLHALSITMGPIPNQSIFVHNNVISHYLSLGEFLHARRVFDILPQRTVVSYNMLIHAYSRRGDVSDAWSLLCHMRGSDFSPTQYTLSGLLSCELLSICQGMQLQALSIKSGLFYADAFVGTALLGLFGRHGCLDEAFIAFEDMVHKSLVTWNIMLLILARNGFVGDCQNLFRDLVRTGVALSEGSFVAVLSGLVDPEQDLEYSAMIHGLMTKCGFDGDIALVNCLINVYVKCKAMFSAQRLFQEVPAENVVSWNTIIDALVKSGRPQVALEMFVNMSRRGLVPSQATFVAVIDSCASLKNFVCGESIHAKVIRNGFESDVVVGTALVDFYAKSDNMMCSHKCFNQIEEKNIVSWNALMVGYSNECSSMPIMLLRQMLQLGHLVNEFSFSASLKSSSVLNTRQLHGLLIKMGYESHEYVLSSLVMAYSRNGLIIEALSFVKEVSNSLPLVPSNIIAGIYNRTCQYYETVKFLSLLESPDTVSWNLVISACARSNNYNEVLELFNHMHVAHIQPDNYTFMSILCVCTKLCHLDLGSSLHGLIMKTNLYNWDTYICNALIDMYGKCGNIDSSVKVFEEMTDKNIITWTALITALGLNGYPHEALKRFKNMESFRLKPDALALRAVLSACRYGGLVSEAMEIFKQMGTAYGIQPELDHYHCIVDLLAKRGEIEEAEKIITSMPFPPNANIWRSFLEGSKRQTEKSNCILEAMH